jgi:hypothetical protein
MGAPTLNLSLPFEVGSRLRIRGEDLEVVVRLVRWDGNELDYWVTWWDDGKRQDAWVRPDELERR